MEEASVNASDDEGEKISQLVKPFVDAIKKSVQDKLSQDTTSNVTFDQSIVPFVPTPSESRSILAHEVKRKQFIKSLRPDDLLLGRWNSANDQHIIIDLYATDFGNKEDISGFELKAFCKFENASPQVALISNSINLRVRVLTVDDEETIFVTIKPNGENSPKLGLLCDEEVPTHFSSSPGRLVPLLEADESFRNPYSTEHLARNFFNLSPDDESSSFARGAQNSFPTNSHAAQLMKKQCRKIASNLVDKGIDAANADSHLQASQYFNKAISVDPDYHRPYFFRSLTFSRESNWIKAIEDMTMAYSLDPGCQFYKEQLYLLYLTYARM